MSDLSEQAKISRDKILKSAEELFSMKGFDGTSVREIAEKAEVNKALIFYYFNSKEGILESLFDALMEDMKLEAIKRLNQEKFQQFKEGHLVVERDKLKFSNLDDDTIDRYMEDDISKSLSFYLERKNIIKIFVAESLKKGDISSRLFKITDSLTDKETNSIPDELKQKGIELQIDNKSLVERFFTGLMPIISFVIYYDEWKEHYHISSEELKAAFIKSYKTTYGNHYRP